MQRFVLDFRTTPHGRVAPHVLECAADIRPLRASLTAFPFPVAIRGAVHVFMRDAHRH
jgi:hypothetical protein